ncbi:MAG: tetratricopeptide repeat protein [Candidatus Aegiribacteria sp.]|nr:tetratricopeptide repeat protein [Candidatus Aegiribacteria sp.]
MSDTFTGETYNTLCNDAEGYLANESPEQARELLQKAISLIGTRPRGRSLLADTCMSMELWVEARSQLEILITLDEGNADNNFRLAQVLEELGEYQLALDNFSVVLDNDSDHHGAKVAIKRIETRTKDSGVNLADIFSSPNSVQPEGTEVAADGKGNINEGMQIFPDAPSDNIFADSEDNEETSVDKLLKNIGISDNSTEEEENDVSELLENIGVSTSQALQSAFADGDGSERKDTPELQEEQEDSDEKKEEVKKAVRSLDEIFGESAGDEEETAVEPEPEAEEPEVEEAEETVAEEEPEPEAEEPSREEEPEPETEEEDESSQFAPGKKDTDESSGIDFKSSKTLEAIFNAPEPEAEEPEVEEAEETVAEEEPEPEAEEPEKEETREESVGVPTAIMKQEADFRIDPWSAESGLITIHMTSGTVNVRKSMLSIYEKPLRIESQEDGTVELSGEGTFLLNCGPEEPLIIEVKENMVIRKEAVILHTGTINAELLDITHNDSIYVIKEKTLEKAIFIADHPVRIILLGGNNRIFYVRTSSIMAADPEILLSHDGTPEGYTEVTGLGKVYLIE